MYKIMFLNNWGGSSESMIERYRFQTPGNDGIWDQLRATTNPAEADFFIIMDGLPARVSENAIPTAKKIYFQREPVEILKYHKFVEDKALFKGSFDRHYSPSTWHIKKSFMEIRDLPRPVKTKKLSCIMSGKAMTPAQRQRVFVLHGLKERFPDVDIFGKGLDPKIFGASYKGALEYNQFCKFRGLIDYEYSYAAENSSHENYFTEKLVDCFLTWTKPLYWGCPNIDRYFPSGSYTWVDIYDKRAVDRIIEETGEPVDYEALREARELVLFKYNLWPSIQNIIANYRDHIGEGIS